LRWRRARSCSQWRPGRSSSHQWQPGRPHPCPGFGAARVAEWVEEELVPLICLDCER
jgi:hypothetical protein